MGLVKTRRLANAAGTGPAKPLKNGPFVGPVPKSFRQIELTAGDLKKIAAETKPVAK